MYQFIQKILVFTMFFLTFSLHAVEPINSGRFSNTAIHGYDVVNYFTNEKAIKGKKEFEYEWKDAVWRFSTVENLEKFKSEPEKYEPQYGGYCAWAASLNKVAPIDPHQFTLYEEKLYFNFNRKTRKNWLKDKDTYIAKADENWPKLLTGEK